MAMRCQIIFIFTVFCSLIVIFGYYTSVDWLSVDFSSKKVNFSYAPQRNTLRQRNRNKFHDNEPEVEGKNMNNQQNNNGINTSKQKNVAYLREKSTSYLRQGNVNKHLKENTTFLQETTEFFLTDSVADRYDKNVAKISNRLVKDDLQLEAKFDEAKVIPLRIFGRQVILYSAIISNSSNTSIWDTLVIQGWEDKNLTNEGYICCVMFQSGVIRKAPLSMKLKRGFDIQFRTKQFVCNLSRVSDLQKNLPDSVTLISDSTQGKCPSENYVFINIEYAYQHPGKLAVCAKAIYGNVSSIDLLAWFEIHRLLGVDRFVFYVYEVNQNVTKLLRYYQNLGIAELVPFKFLNASYAYTFEKRHFNDEAIILTDVFERFQGYKYILHIDIDEYLVPNRNETLISLFERLTKWYPDGAGFIFLTCLYVTSWGKSSDQSLFKVGQYLDRTTPIQDRVKNFILPSRVMRGRYKMHFFDPIRPFRRYMVPESEAVLRHYRKCRTVFLGTNKGCYDFKRYKDNRVYRLFKPIEKRVLRLKNQLGI